MNTYIFTLPMARAIHFSQEREKNGYYSTPEQIIEEAGSIEIEANSFDEAMQEFNGMSGGEWTSELRECQNFKVIGG